MLHEDFELEWPQSGEHIIGVRNFGEVNSHYPAKGKWTFDVRTLVADENRAVTEVAVSDGSLFATVVSFFEMKDGRIFRIREYWPDPFEPAAWRAEWVSR